MRPLPSTLLFCPGDRSERFAKAWASQAPGVVLDLEDSVAAPNKAVARDNALSWLRAEAGRHPQVLPALRINPLRSAAGLGDAVALLQADGLPEQGCLLLPKLDDAGELAWFESHLLRRLPGWTICGLIESAQGLRELDRLVARSRMLGGLGFGAADLQAELGTAAGWSVLAPARAMLVLAAAGTRLRLLDVPCLAIADELALREECRQAQAIGFHGKFAIHPRQVQPIQEAFAPSDERIAQARRVVEAYQAAGGQACQIDGAMVDEPIYRQALRCLDAAR